MSPRRQLAFVAFVTGGSACIAGYGLAIVALVWSHSEPVVRVPSSVGAAPHQAEIVIAPADLPFDVTRLIGSRDTVIEQIIAERTQAVLDRDRAVAERDAAFAERDAALAADREMLIDIHA